MKFINDPSLAGKQQENEPGNTGNFQVKNLLNSIDLVLIHGTIYP
jgi:hypothetical protein